MSRKALLRVVIVLALTFFLSPTQAQSQGLATAAQVAPVPGGPGFRMLHAAAFHPSKSATSYTSLGPVLFTLTGSTNITYWAPLDLPNHATVTRVVFYFNDSDDNFGKNIQLAMRRLPLPGSVAEAMATLDSTGSVHGDVALQSTVIVSPDIDLGAYAYYLELTMPASTNSSTAPLHFSGARVDYEFNSAVPIISK